MGRPEKDAKKAAVCLPQKSWVEAEKGSMKTIFEPVFVCYAAAVQRVTEKAQNVLGKGMMLWHVLIVEDQMIMQKYFEYLILQEPEFRLVKTAADARKP